MPFCDESVNISGLCVDFEDQLTRRAIDFSIIGGVTFVCAFFQVMCWRTVLPLIVIKYFYSIYLFLSPNLLLSNRFFDLIICSNTVFTQVLLNSGV